MNQVDPKTIQCIVAIAAFFVGIGVAWGGATVTLRSLKESVKRIEAKLHNGLSEDMAAVKTKVENLEEAVESLSCHGCKDDPPPPSPQPAPRNWPVATPGGATLA